MHTHMPHMKSLAPTIQQEVVYTYLIHIIEQIWLLHSNIAQMPDMLYWHIDPTFLDK